MPEISVIMPVYNKETYFEAAIRSVLNQPFADLEVIVVNDGSTDGSLALAQKIAEEDQRVCLIDIPNSGVSKARNMGLSQATGNWIQFLDADDTLEPDYLAEAMQILRQKQADILFSAFSMVDIHGKTVRSIPAPMQGEKTQSELQECFIRYQYESGFFGYISNKLFRRSLLEKSHAKFPEGIRLAEDLDFYAKLYPAVERAYFWSGVSFRYLQTAENYLNNSDIDYYAQLCVHLDIKKWFKKRETYSKYKNILDEKVTRYAYYILFYDNEKGQNLSVAFQFLRAHEDVMESIAPDCMKGFQRKVLHCLLRNDLFAVRVLFAGRNGARALFRMVKRSD